ncbi:hypothetical protein JCM14244_06790 [Venenivibrio stagnispumantis]|uniref:Flagellar hook protein FlgE n=1 Tax=Venenivibrio stagnispumantis TaxID=407998 RepID=A0AA46ACS5_9AQUI|nr:flagellar hook-basal body complex protein [Venenivibrio stagnispumantis]MCW4572624.1 flagellar hook-basal body complex protein [Venenivibrio stagnispumantis]SMP00651.1 flagellar hook-basal body protein [Venenivibrio stagnispumantis]
MIQAMWTGNTGLNADQYWLSVISDNIANVNTIGYKYERASFEDMITSSLTTFSNNVPKNMEIGGGAIVANTQKIFTQGNFSQTNVPTDLALEGQGFFMVADNNGTIYYTRNGQFRLNADGDLVNTLGLKLQGWTLDDNGNMVGAIGSINIPYSQPPKTTTKISVDSPSNLDSRSNIITATFNPADSTTFNYVNTMTVYDSLGNPHKAQFYFVRTGGNQWRVFGLLDDEPIQFTVPGDTNTYDALLLEFNGTGQISSIKGYGKDMNCLDNCHGTTLNEDSGDAGEYQLPYYPVIPGSVLISNYNGTTVNWIDDGNGNIIDLITNNSIGTIDYNTGKITINQSAGTSSSENIQVAYRTKVYESGDTGEYTLVNTPILPGSVSISQYNGTTVNWIDDGAGNIIDLKNNNQIVGSINYTTGKITINQSAGTSSSENIQVAYKIYFTTISTNTIQPDQISILPISANNPNSVGLNTGANPIQFSLNLQNLRQLASDFLFTGNQDGYSKGDLLSVFISEDGVIKGSYSNGTTKNIARLATAVFKDTEMLVRKGTFLYLPNQQTPTPIVAPGGVLNKIRSGMLEMSNVDISREFINLIVAQRAYQANARVITTSDQVLQEAMNIKR